MEIGTARNARKEQYHKMVKSGEDNQTAFLKNNSPCENEHCKTFDKCNVCKEQFELDLSNQIERNQCIYCEKISKSNTEKKDTCEYCKKYEECNVCIDQFELESNTQSEEKQCKYCKSTFKSSSKKKYRCEYCDNTFKKQVKKRLKCDNCDTNFKNEGKKNVSSKNCDKNIKNSLRISSLNICRGLFKKEERLLNTMNETKCDIFSVSEVDIEDFDEKKPYSLEGYKTYFPLKRTGTNTKRMLCFVKDTIEATERQDLMSDLLSNVWLELKGKNQKILVCTMYREFNDLTRKGQMSQNEQIERLHILHTQMEKASKEGLILLIGDLNINLLEWEKPSFYLKNLA